MVKTEAADPSRLDAADERLRRAKRICRAYAKSRTTHREARAFRADLRRREARARRTACRRRPRARARSATRGPPASEDPDPDPALWATPREASAESGVPLQTVYSRLARGELAHVLLGGGRKPRKRIAPQALEALRAERRPS
jgi:hypothetical protein